VLDDVGFGRRLLLQRRRVEEQRWVHVPVRRAEQ
jgi:hypothetical protein